MVMSGCVHIDTVLHSYSMHNTCLLRRNGGPPTKFTTGKTSLPFIKQKLGAGFDIEQVSVRTDIALLQHELVADIALLRSS